MCLGYSSPQQYLAPTELQDSDPDEPSTIVYRTLDIAEDARSKGSVPRGTFYPDPPPELQTSDPRSRRCGPTARAHTELDKVERSTHDGRPRHIHGAPVPVVPTSVIGQVIAKQATQHTATCPQLPQRDSSIRDGVNTSQEEPPIGPVPATLEK